MIISMCNSSMNWKEEQSRSSSRLKRASAGKVELIHETLNERVFVRDGTALLLCDLLGPVVTNASISRSKIFWVKVVGRH